MNIPDEAVEAAWEQSRKDSDGYPYPEREETRRILEAAAPHMAAPVWDEGYRAGAGDCDYETENPYIKAAGA